MYGNNNGHWREYKPIRQRSAGALAKGAGAIGGLKHFAPQTNNFENPS